MPFDPETGVWISGGDRPYSLPATSSGDVLSAFNSWDAYQRSQQQRTLEILMKLRQGGEAGADVAATPSGSEALGRFGIGPTEVQDMYLQSPEARFQQQIKEKQVNGWPVTDELVSQVGLETGALDPKTYLGSESRSLGARARQQDADTKAQSAFNTAARNEWNDAVKVSDTQPQAEALFKRRIKFLYPNEPDERINMALAGVQATFGGREGADVEKKKAEAGAAQARAKVLIDSLPARLNLMNSRAALDQANAGLKKMQTEVADAKLNGTLPASEADYLAALAKADNVLVQAEKIYPVGPQKATLPPLLTELRARVDGLKKELGQEAAPAAPKKKAAPVEKPVEKPVPKGALGPSTRPDGEKNSYQGKPIVSRGGFWYYETSGAAAVR